MHQFTPDMTFPVFSICTVHVWAVVHNAYLHRTYPLGHLLLLVVAAWWFATGLSGCHTEPSMHRLAISVKILFMVIMVWVVKRSPPHKLLTFLT